MLHKLKTLKGHHQEVTWMQLLESRQQVWKLVHEAAFRLICELH